MQKNLSAENTDMQVREHLPEGCSRIVHRARVTLSEFSSLSTGAFPGLRWQCLTPGRAGAPLWAGERSSAAAATAWACQHWANYLIRAVNRADTLLLRKLKSTIRWLNSCLSWDQEAKGSG